VLRRIAIIALAIYLIAAGSLWAQELGSASGKGKIERATVSGNSEWVSFFPRYSFAYSEMIGGKKFTWIVLTEKEPPLKTWSAVKDPNEARRLWCEKEKTPYAAVMLTPDWKVNQYVLCPADGGMNTEMLSSWNGLDSIIVKFQVRSGKQLKGTLLTGTGSCPDGTDGGQKYCEPTGDYTFDAVMSK